MPEYKTTGKGHFSGSNQYSHPVVLATALHCSSKAFPRTNRICGTKDTFSESSKLMDLLKKYGLGVLDIVATSEKPWAENKID